MLPLLPAAWQPVLGEERDKPYFQDLERFLDEEYRTKTVYPPREQVFTALELTPYEEVKVLLLGQDPYPGPGQAHGLAFSVQPKVRTPGSLVNMFKELRDDLGCRIPNNGYLVPWARQGVLLLNAVLTVEAGAANWHKDKGWERFTDAAIRKVNELQHPVVFLLWGRYAQKKESLIDASRHRVIKGAHPSPLSVHLFRGSKPFSQVNEALRATGQKEIDWQIPDI